MRYQMLYTLFLNKIVSLPTTKMVQPRFYNTLNLIAFKSLMVMVTSTSFLSQTCSSFSNCISISNTNNNRMKLWKCSNSNITCTLVLLKISFCLGYKFLNIE
ncbi:hypothetical protein PNOK_m000122 (mitochondrion) [Pyrrhoderma noxium]|uniref:Uncharacterized protein n=1 Tax=Pyrrhoderma noxium TaxID=2282107 RepID=A0A541AXR3_9AGAM|nr:hypothetical protein PNOK_m000122 [Pyrrhoderma noxium]